MNMIWIDVFFLLMYLWISDGKRNKVVGEYFLVLSVLGLFLFLAFFLICKYQITFMLCIVSTDYLDLQHISNFKTHNSNHKKQMHLLRSVKSIQKLTSVSLQTYLKQEILCVGSPQQMAILQTENHRHWMTHCLLAHPSASFFYSLAFFSFSLNMTTHLIHK